MDNAADAGGRQRDRVRLADPGDPRALGRAAAADRASRIGRISSAIAITAVGASATIATLVFVQLLAQGEEERTFVVNLGVWFRAGSFQVDWSLLVDPLASVMLLLVTWVGLLIHIYSLGYMAQRRALHPLLRLPQPLRRLDAGARPGRQLPDAVRRLGAGRPLQLPADRLLVRAARLRRRGQEGVHHQPHRRRRVPDRDVRDLPGLRVAGVHRRAACGRDGAPRAPLVAIALLLFVGATGKSAQIPLYVWLPDAMAGPTPVSRADPRRHDGDGRRLPGRADVALWALVPDVGLLVAWVGAATALVAAIIACAQTDLKKILAYSTVSQLGYMFIGGRGRQIQVAGDLPPADPRLLQGAALPRRRGGDARAANHTDVGVMGGLWRKLPITGTTSLIGVRRSPACPFLSGFFSKEEILAHAAETRWCSRCCGWSRCSSPGSRPST